MVDVVSKVTADGGAEITDTKRPSNYESEIGAVNGKLPEAPSFENVSKLFAPRWVLNVTAPDLSLIHI